MNDDDRLTHLEGTVSFQDRTIEELSQVVRRQEERLERLEARLTELHEGLIGGGPLVRDASDEEPPPHY